MKFTTVALSAMILSASPSYAYIPPGNFIVQSWVKKHQDLKSIRIESIVSAGANHFKEISYYDLRAKTLKSFAQDDSGRALYHAIQVGPDVAPATHLLLDPGYESVLRLLKQSEIKVDQESLKRWKTLYAWVLGMPDAPELWFEKDIYLPLRLLTKTAVIEFSTYRFQHGIYYPHVIEVSQNNALVLHDELVDYQANGVAPEFKEHEMPGFTEAAVSIPQSLRELIQKYYELIR